MEVCENTYRLFYQSLERVKHQLNEVSRQVICGQQTGEDGEGINQKRLLLIINEHFGECDLVLLVLILGLLTMSNHETFIAYQQAFSESTNGVAPPPRPSKREEELEEQLIDSQKKFGKLQKENEQVSVVIAGM